MQGVALAGKHLSILLIYMQAAVHVCILQTILVHVTMVLLASGVVVTRRWEENLHGLTIICFLS